MATSSSSSITVADTTGVGPFQTLQDTFSSTRRSRPPMHLSTDQESETRVPLKPVKLQRRESKGGLRSIFTRNKVEKIVSTVQEEAFVSGIPEQSITDTIENNYSLNISEKRTSTLPGSTLATPAKPASKASRMNLRSRSIIQNKTPVSKPVPKSSPKTTPKPPIRTSAAWDPPPLFQAYPQAIKHAQLSASTLSADSILRIRNHKRNNSLRDEIAQTRANSEGQDQSAAARKTEKAKNKHRRQISGSISKTDWTQKIFVLVTSGYLLQYSGEGSFDRLPEKMMQLGKDSVAFASDVIPGKHWVLQISQAMDSDGMPAADSRSLLSRLAFRSADYRRTATSLLLVLNSAEDMDSWIAVVRREIEALGGRKHVSETGKPKPDDKIMQLRAQPSHRYLVQRNPDQFSNPSSPMTPTFGPPPWIPDGQPEAKFQDEASVIRPGSASTRPPTGHRSVANSILSHDGRQLDSLRDSNLTSRFSYMSSGQRTLITSQGSSTASSPTRESMSTLDDYPRKISSEDIRPRPNAYAINERRRSIQTVQNPLMEPSTLPFRPHSTFGVPSRPPRSYSPPSTPNFSVPASSSKRYSAVKPPVLQTPPIPSIITTTPSKSMLKGTRKAPPAALNVPRSLSPVLDSSSSKSQLRRYTATESSCKKLEQIKASMMIDIPPQSPNSPSITSRVEINPPRRFSSLMPSHLVETSHTDVQSAWRHSSIQVPREAVEKLPIASPGSHAVPSVALALPLPSPPFVAESEQPVSEGETYSPDREMLSPLPILPSAKPKLRRPPSMPIQPMSKSVSTTITVKPTRSPQSVFSNRVSGSATSSEALNRGEVSPAPASFKSPLIQRLKEDASPKLLGSRRSMPVLMNGPPPAPPPDCALPPLPPGNGALRSPLSLRNSVRV